MTTGVNAGQVRGPIQLTFARSISPIVPLDVSITRVAITKPEDAQYREAEDEREGTGKGKVTEIGRKPIVPYGLYVGYGFFSAPFAAQTEVTPEDLELFWTALMNMWDIDHSASRGMMACRGLYVFSHETGLGNAPAHLLFNRLEARPRKDAGDKEIEAPRRYEDYVVYLNGTDMPVGVTLTQLVGDD